MAHELHVQTLWAFYTFFNLVSIYFNSSLISAILLLESRQSTDILVAGLSGGLIIGAMGCGPYCLLSLINGQFAYVDITCRLESVGHIIGMVVSFLVVAAIAHRTYVGVVKNQVYSPKRAYYSLLIIYLLSMSGTFLTGRFSRVYLVKSGAFCFFEWSSLALTAFAWPAAVIAALLMSFWYFNTYKFVQSVRSKAQELVNKQPVHIKREFSHKLALRLSSLILLFVVAYCPVVSLSWYEIAGNRASATFDVIAAVFVLMYWISAPVAYARINRRLGWRSVLRFSPQPSTKSQPGSNKQSSQSDPKMQIVISEVVQHVELTKTGIPQDQLKIQSEISDVSPMDRSTPLSSSTYSQDVDVPFVSRISNIEIPACSPSLPKSYSIADPSATPESQVGNCWYVK